jgi:hypothetical protein
VIENFILQIEWWFNVRFRPFWCINWYFLGKLRFGAILLRHIVFLWFFFFCTFVITVKHLKSCSIYKSILTIKSETGWLQFEMGNWLFCDPLTTAIYYLVWVNFDVGKVATVYNLTINIGWTLNWMTWVEKGIFPRLLTCNHLLINKSWLLNAYISLENILLLMTFLKDHYFLFSCFTFVFFLKMQHAFEMLLFK